MYLLKEYSPSDSFCTFILTVNKIGRLYEKLYWSLKNINSCYIPRLLEGKLTKLLNLSCCSLILLSNKLLTTPNTDSLTNLLSRYNPTRSIRSQKSGPLGVPRIVKSTKGGRTFTQEELQKLQSGSNPQMIWDDRTPEKRWCQPLGGPQRRPTISDYTELTTFCHKLIILSFYNINLF